MVHGVSAVAVTPDGRRVISASCDQHAEGVGPGDGQPGAHADRAWSLGAAVAVTPDGRRVVSASDDRTLKVWDLATGQQLASITLEAGIQCVAVAPDG